MLHSYRFFLIAVLNILLVIRNNAYGRLGLQEIPQFKIEPPSTLTFLNTTGAVLNCAIRHSQVPAQIKWVVGETGLVPVVNVVGIREMLSNGSLVFHPFSPTSYRQDVHSASYRCLVSSIVGSLVSRTVSVRAVVYEDYEVRVYDEYVISGNTAVLKCHIAPYVQEYVKVISWVQDNSLIIKTGIESGVKYMILHDGSLHIYRADPSDGYRSYRCKTNHTLTGEVRDSSAGRVIITEPHGDSPPRLTVTKKIQITVRNGANAILPCAAQAHPTPTYSWERVGDSVVSEVVGTSPRFSQVGGLLLMANIGVGDQGRYICHVNNSLGRDFIEIALRVTEPLSVHIAPNRLVIDMGQSATFRCIVQGHPVTSLTWLRNGLPLPTDTRIVSSSRETLTISRVEKNDRGIYQCFISARHHTTQAAAILGLGDSLPELLYRFQQQTLQPGPSVSLKCVAGGNPPPQFSWNLDGFPLPDSDRFLVGQYVTIHDDVISHVNITNVRVEDGGVYQCSASNSIGTVSHRASVRVYGLPFIRQMRRVIAVAGSDLNIKCPVAGYPIEEITWSKDGKRLPVKGKQSIYANGTLIIRETERGTDEGIYTCKASSRHGHTSSRDVTITVTVPPKIMPFVFTNKVLSEGNRASITCQILEGDLPVSFRWEKDGLEVPMYEGIATRLLDDYSTQLVIESISSRHNGDYTCLASNDAATRQHTATLTVNVPPHWTSEPGDVTVSQGSEVTLNCQADGYPKPKITWKKTKDRTMAASYNYVTTEPNKIISDNGSLIFRSAEKSHEGNYICEANNGIKSGVSKMVSLTVNSPAYFPEKMTRTVIRIGEKVQLKCEVLGDKPIDVLWYINSRRLDATSDRKMNIKNKPNKEGVTSTAVISGVQREHSGSYTCNAANSYGRDSKIIELIVQEEPESPRNLRIVETQSRTIALTWSTPYSGNTPIQNYIIQYKLASETWPSQPLQINIPGAQTKGMVNELKPAAAYHLRVIAQNALGLGNPSEVIQATTEEEEPSGPPREIRVTPESSTSLRVKWEPPSRDQWNGNILGYYIGHRPYAVSSEYNFRTIEVGSQYGGSATLSGLKKYTRYEVVIQAYNNRGAGPTSSPVIETTLEDAPSSPPETIRCESTAPESMSVAWRPPPEKGQNGLIKGYRVLYQREVDYPEINALTKTTGAESTNLFNLEKFTNYSIAVQAYTSAGNGVASIPIFCRTLQDVPQPPSKVKAVVNTPNSILVTWLPPKKINGELLKYTLYGEITTHGAKKSLSPVRLRSDETSYLVDGLSINDVCSFWLTASTPPGEGKSSPKITVKPKQKVGAHIASFGVQLEVPWKEDILLHCHSVGEPLPKIIWRQNGIIVTSGERIQILPNGSLFIRDIQKADAGNLTCTANNTYNSDEITYKLIVQVPPAPPSLFVQQSGRNSLTLKWTLNPRQSSIKGYIINFKREFGDWEEVQLHSPKTINTLSALVCGSRYQLYVTAYNKVGTGLPSEILTASTKGTEPVPPSVSRLIDVNSTSVMVHLSTFGDGGCPIQYFAIEYKLFGDKDWISVSNNVAPTEKAWIIRDLLPATKYTIKITAHNTAGLKSTVHHVKTRNPVGIFAGGTNGVPVETGAPEIPIHQDPKVVVPSLVVAILFITIIAAVTVWMVKRQRTKKSDQETTPTKRIHGDRNIQQNQQYAALAPHSISTQDTSTYKGDSIDYHEEICPYATFQLPPVAKSQYGEATETGIVYSGAYHPVQGAFVYHEPKRPNVESFPLRHKEPEYMKVRRKGRRDHHMESTESDNLGSTDSEVKKILSLHMPISEYDTLGSDSEGAGPTDSPPTFAESAALSHAIVHHPAHKSHHGHSSHMGHLGKKAQIEQLPHRSNSENKHRLRGRTDGSKSHEESSSSSDTSSSDHRSHHRRGKKITKRSSRVGSRTPYEETSFSYNQGLSEGLRIEETHKRNVDTPVPRQQYPLVKSSYGGKSSGIGRRSIPAGENVEERINGDPPPLPPRGTETEESNERRPSASKVKGLPQQKYYKKGLRPRGSFQINV